MNHRPSGLQLSKALVGFLQYKAAEGLSPNTLRTYKHHLTVWLDYAGEDTEVSQVTSQDLRAYLAWLRTDYKPRRLTGGDQPLAPRLFAMSGQPCAPSSLGQAWNSTWPIL